MDVIERALPVFADLPENTERRIICPACSHQRKKKRDRTLAIKREGDAILYHCWHCEEKGSFRPRREVFKAVEKQPEPKALSVEAVRWLQDRGISKETADQYDVFTTRHWFRRANGEREAIGFPYQNMSETYASKLRCIEQKDYSCIGAPKTFFGVNHIGDLDRIIIVEGEMDVLAMHEAGVKNSVAVPNGAPDRPVKEVISPEHDTKFQYLWNSKDLLENADAIYLAGDNDRPGSILMEELARRIGRHKCWKVEWPSDCKDANDTLLKHGAETVRECIENAERYPVSGLYLPSEFKEGVIDFYKNGAGKGHSTGYPSVDEIFTLLPGTLNVVTGIPSSGKSEFLDQLAINVGKRYDWVTAVASFENPPEYHITKLAAKYVGKHFFVGPNERMTGEEMERALEWIEDHFVFCTQLDGDLSTVEGLIERLAIAVLRHGIRVAIIDPVNYIERPADVNETVWAHDALTKLRMFAQAHDIVLFLVAHPAKMHRGEGGRVPIPRGYDISGSAAYINKSDFGLTIHRDVEEEPSLVTVLNWKTRFGWAGKMGDTSVVYDVVSTNYVEPTPDAPWIEDD